MDRSIPYNEWSDQNSGIQYCPPWPFPRGPELAVQYIEQRAFKQEEWLLGTENLAGMQGGAAAAEARQ